jgi:polysaccharide biosynthesis/export protein
MLYPVQVLKRAYLQSSSYELRARTARPSLRPLALLASVVLMLSACTDGYVRFPVTTEAQRALSSEIEVVVLDATNITNFTRPARGNQPTTMPSGGGWTYLVGPGDVLSVIVFDNPALTLPAGPQRSAADSGFQVGADGTINYPYIGQVRARGQTVEQIRGEITQRLRSFIADPQVEVRVAAYNSQAVVVSGEVRTPNRQALTAVPLTLIEAINAAGGFVEAADPRHVTVQRGGTMHHVDVQGFLSGGLTGNNPLLRNGDVVHVPRRRAEEAYLLGEVGRQSAIDLSREPITLTQAITRSGGLQPARADARGVLVFRRHGEGIRVFQLDTSNPAGLLLGTRFVLEPSDVVYILRSPLQRWNDTISRLLPSVQAIQAADSLAGL